jgi:hypothetical protein
VRYTHDPDTRAGHLIGNTATDIHRTSRVTDHNHRLPFPHRCPHIIEPGNPRHEPAAGADFHAVGVNDDTHSVQ